jgi:hypothetical protein
MFLSLFQTASGSWHIQSILIASGWFLTGILLFVQLAANRAERLESFEKEQKHLTKIADLENKTKPIAILNEQVNTITQKTKQVEKQLAWRTLGPASERKLLDALLARHISVSVAWTGNDPEQVAYAKQFITAFEKVGLLAGTVGGGIINPAPPPGLSVSSHDPANGVALISALRACGLNPKNIGSSIFGGTVLWIGPKPRPEQ